MRLLKKVKQHRLEKYLGYTISNDTFLPVFIGTGEETEAVIKGKLVLGPVADKAFLQSLLAQIPEEFIGKSDWDAVRAGGLANLTELMAKQISMYPLVFEDGKFLKPDRRFKRIGDMAVVILYPDIFLQRLQGAVGMRYANQYYAMTASVQYRGVSTDPYRFDIFDRDPSEHWKQEMLFGARMNPNLRVTDLNREILTETMPLMTGDLSDIAVRCPVKDLVNGRFPEELLAPAYIQYLNSFQIAKKEVKQWILHVAANVMSIVPTAEWIEKLQAIFVKDKWKPMAQVEKLFEDGDGMPRLAFFENDGRDQVFIHINRISFYFYDYGAEQRKLVNDLVAFVEKECKTRFCHMKMETHADLGAIKDKHILSQTGFRQERTCQRGDLFEHQFIEADYKLVPSVMGLELARKDWHYAVRLFTPDHENTMWYDADMVKSFFEEAAASNQDRIKYLMKGDAYGRYRKIR